MSKPLSPAAQAVLDAVADALVGGYSGPAAYDIAAAAAKALAEQVAPDEPDDTRAAIHDHGWWDKHDLIRFEILDIVTELEAS